MLKETERKGEVAFSKCALQAAELGWIVSRPTTSARYDAVLDDGTTRYRVQVKYADASPRNGTVTVGLRRRSNSRKAIDRVYVEGEVDVLILYLPCIDKLLWMDPKYFVGKTAVTVRVAPSNNKQVKRILYVDEFVW